MKIAKRVVLSLFLAAALARPSIAQKTEVDAQLILAVDVSYSMSVRELEIQRRGYAEALTSPEVIKVITSGMLGRVSIMFMEWAGTGSQRIIVPWTLVDGAESASVFADQLVSNFSTSLRRTSISGALSFASRQFEISPYVSNRRIIDVSGDGPNNMGEPVLDARDRVLDQGIVINGLPLMTRDGVDRRFFLEDLDEYYRQCVVGGPASFVIPVTEWAHFPEAVRRKLVLELARTQRPKDFRLRSIAFAGATESGYNCMIGEAMWQRFRLDPFDN